MSKLNQLKTDLTAICKSKSVCLWFSGGSDSRLLLEILLSEKLNFCILSLTETWTRAQQSVIDKLVMDRNVAVYSYLPQSAMLIGDGDQITMAQSYAVGANGEEVMILRDIVDGKPFRCGLDINMKIADKTFPPIIFDNHIWGTRGEDRHYVFGDEPVITTSAWRNGAVNFFAPLLKWSKSDVTRALKDLGIDYETPADDLDTGNLVVCAACFHGNPVVCPKTQTMIEPIDWNPAANLAVCRERNQRVELR